MNYEIRAFGEEPKQRGVGENCNNTNQIGVIKRRIIDKNIEILIDSKNGI